MADGGRQCTMTQTVINRREIEFAIIPQARHEVPFKRGDDNWHCETLDCLFSLHRYWIEGSVHVPTVDCDSAPTFLQQLDSFFLVTNVRVKAMNVGQIRAPVLFANKRYIGSFSLRAAPVSESTTDTTSAETSTEVDWLLEMDESKQLADR